MRFIRTLALFAMLATSSFAAIMYDFTYTAEDGVFDNFHFQIQTENYLTTNPAVPFTPFTITAGADQFTISRLDVYQLPWADCYTFGSDNAGVGQCGGGPGNPGNAFIASGFYYNMNSPGTYTAPGTLVQAQKMDWTMLEGSGTLTLRIGDASEFSNSADTPEPASIALMGLGLLGLGVIRARRRSGKQ